MRAAVIVPTLNAGPVWQDWIDELLATGIGPDNVYVVDSGSSDETVPLAREAGFNITQIDPVSFNHGGTRKRAVENLEGFDFVIFLTQDAILKGPEALTILLLPFDDAEVGAVCGRQLPRKNSGHIEAHARLFNYPELSTVNSMEDVPVKGLKAAFISNSFSAYRISVLNDVGSFPENVIFGEDMYVAAKMLVAGYKVAYQADACVFHSHGYSFWQEMRRYFDMGVFHAREPWIRLELGGAEYQGFKFVSSEFKYLVRTAIWKIPEGLLRTVFRYAGFRLGLLEQKIPLSLKKQLAMNKKYFKIS